MRHGRAKAARRTLQFFERTVGIKAPYHVLVDGTFLVAVVTHKVPLHDRLEKLLQHGNTYSLYCTDTALMELEKLVTVHAARKKQSSEVAEKIEIFRNAIQWAKDNCQIIEMMKQPTTKANKNDIPSCEQCSTVFRIPSKVWSTLSDAASDMLRLLLSSAYSTIKLSNDEAAEVVKVDGTDDKLANINDNLSSAQSTKYHHTIIYYFCASQDEELLEMVRQCGKVPVIRLARGSVLLLEQPSKAAQGTAVQEERMKWKSSSVITDTERQLVDIVRQQDRQKRKMDHDDDVKKKQKQHNELYGHSTDKNTTSEYDRRKKRNKAKGPNPLSCKRAKK